MDKQKYLKSLKGLTTDQLILKALEQVQQLDIKHHKKIKENTKRIKELKELLEEDEKAMLNIQKATELLNENIDIITKITEDHEKAINLLNEKIVGMN